MEMSETELKIVEAAIRTFVRYGARKTAMADIAQEAKVSRQTLYDVFGGKDELIIASIRHITDQNLSRVNERLGEADSLEDQIDIYFAETIIKSFELLLPILRSWVNAAFAEPIPSLGVPASKNRCRN